MNNGHSVGKILLEREPDKVIPLSAYLFIPAFGNIIYTDQK